MWKRFLFYSLLFLSLFSHSNADCVFSITPCAVGVTASYDPTIGSSASGSQTFGYIQLERRTATAPATVFTREENWQDHYYSQAGPVSILSLVYSDSSGNAGNLLAAATVVNSGQFGSVNWIPAIFGQPLTINNGTVYWVGYGEASTFTGNLFYLNTWQNTCTSGVTAGYMSPMTSMTPPANGTAGNFVNLGTIADYEGFLDNCGASPTVKPFSLWQFLLMGVN